MIKCKGKMQVKKLYVSHNFTFVTIKRMYFFKSESKTEMLTEIIFR